MAHNESAPRGGHGTPDSHAAGGAHAAAHDAHAHPTWKQYKWVALILTLITVVEVWVYYIPAFVATKLFAPWRSFGSFHLLCVTILVSTCRK